MSTDTDLKRFCEDCKWFRESSWIFNYDRCSNPVFAKNFVSRCNYPLCGDLNKKGECERFKRKWWKIWAKK